IPVLFGSKNEVSIGDNILRSVDRKINLINLIGKTSLQELFSSVKLCSFFLTNDSGPMHIAAALNIPMAAIFGSTNDITTGPFSLNSTIIKSNMECSPCISEKCKYGTYQCMKNITPEIVIKSLNLNFN
nr:ADP-heptose--LPS heptosyltransferase [Candidatus Dependentiae bacterium]